MKLNQVKSFMDAAKSADIKKFAFFDDIGTMYHDDGERAFLLLNESDETLWNFRKALHSEALEGIAVIANNIDDIRRAEVIGSYDQIKTFINKYGLSLTDEQLKILLILDTINKEVIPITGDYHNIFHKLSQEEYDALSPEEKAEYDEHVKEEEKRYALPKGVSAQITV